MSYNHLNINERSMIAYLKNKGISLRKIAETIGRNVSTISRELKRNFTQSYRKKYNGQNYFPLSSQKRYEKRISVAHRIVQYSDEVFDTIESCIKESWSPEQISNFYRDKKFPCYKTIYKWIHRGIILNGNMKLLRRKGKGGWYETRGKFNRGKSIRKRDKSVYKRENYGHWELDTVVSGHHTGCKSCFITIAERKSRYYKVIKSPDKSASNVANLIIEFFKQLPNKLVKTLTCDNGTEFAQWERIEKELSCPVYFCDTFCAWQKGTNENLNGQLREFFPKGHNLGRFTQKYIDQKVSLINRRPRKCNNWKSAQDLFNEAIANCCT